MRILFLETHALYLRQDVFFFFPAFLNHNKAFICVS